MEEYVVRSKKVFRELFAVKKEIKQLLIDGAKNEDVVEKYIPIIVEKFYDYKESYLINNTGIGYSEITGWKTTVIEVFKSGTKIQNPNPHTIYNKDIPFEEGNKVCKIISEKLSDTGFLEKKEILEKAKKDDKVLKQLIKNKLYSELVEVGKSPRMKTIFKKIGDIDNLVTDENIDYIFDLDLIDIIDLKKVYNNGDTLLDIVNDEFIKSEYSKAKKSISYGEDNYNEVTHKKYIIQRGQLLGLGAKTKYEIIYEEAKNEKNILANRLLKRSLQGIYGFNNGIDDNKLEKIYYILITLLQAENPKVLKEVTNRINEVIFNGVFNVKINEVNFLDYFFIDKRYPNTSSVGRLGIGKQNFNLNYLAFNEIQLPRLEKPYPYDFEFIFSNTKEVGDNAIKFLINNESIKNLLFSYFDAMKFLKIIKYYSYLLEMKDYFITRFFYDRENKFLIRVDKLDRNIYNLYIYGDGLDENNKEFKKYFIAAFEKLEIKNKLEFLSQRDYLGRNTLHYAFLKEDKEMLEVISKLYDNENNQKELDKIAKEADYFNRLPGEYNKIKELDINKKLTLGKKERAKGSFNFLYGPSIFDIINIMISEEGVNYKGELIVGNDMYSEIGNRLKYYKEKEIKINDRYINFKRLLEYTDNINISKEKSIKRNLRTTFKDEGYKFIHVLQRLGYSIVKTESKSNVILKKFEGLEEKNEKLYEIKEVILTNLIETLGSILYYDNEDILKVYHEESKECTRREKVNIKPPSNNLKFIDQKQLSQVIDYSGNKFLGYQNEDEAHKDFEVVDKLTEVLYGEKVLTLFKNLKDLCDSYKNIEPENVIWKFLELNEEIEINDKSKVIRVLNRNSITREYQYYLKGKGYEIEII